MCSMLLSHWHKIFRHAKFGHDATNIAQERGNLRPCGSKLPHNGLANTGDCHSEFEYRRVDRNACIEELVAVLEKYEIPDAPRLRPRPWLFAVPSTGLAVAVQIPRDEFISTVQNCPGRVT